MSCIRRLTGRLIWGFTPRSARSPACCGGCSGVAGNPSATAGACRGSTDSAQSDGRVSRTRLTVAKALPLIYRRSKRTGALLPREEHPDTPTTAEIPVVAAPSSSMWRLPRALPLAWILYLAGLLIFTLLPLPSDPVAACAAIIHWDNYVPFGSFVAVADQFPRRGELRRDRRTRCRSC